MSEQIKGEAVECKVSEVKEKILSAESFLKITLDKKESKNLTLPVFKGLLDSLLEIDGPAKAKLIINEGFRGFAEKNWQEGLIIPDCISVIRMPTTYYGYTVPDQYTQSRFEFSIFLTYDSKKGKCNLYDTGKNIFPKGMYRIYSEEGMGYTVGTAHKDCRMEFGTPADPVWYDTLIDVDSSFILQKDNKKWKFEFSWKEDGLNCKLDGIPFFFENIMDKPIDTSELFYMTTESGAGFESCFGTAFPFGIDCFQIHLYTTPDSIGQRFMKLKTPVFTGDVFVEFDSSCGDEGTEYWIDGKAADL